MALAAARKTIAAPNARHVPGVALDHVPAQPAADDMPERGWRRSRAGARPSSAIRSGRPSPCAPQSADRAARRRETPPPEKRRAARSPSPTPATGYGWSAGSGPVRVTAVSVPPHRSRGEDSTPLHDAEYGTGITVPAAPAPGPASRRHVAAPAAWPHQGPGSAWCRRRRSRRRRDVPSGASA